VADLAYLEKSKRSSFGSSNLIEQWIFDVTLLAGGFELWSFVLPDSYAHYRLHVSDEVRGWSKGVRDFYKYRSEIYEKEKEEQRKEQALTKSWLKLPGFWATER
jgi:hypothetical protein